MSNKVNNTMPKIGLSGIHMPNLQYPMNMPMSQNAYSQQQQHMYMQQQQQQQQVIIGIQMYDWMFTIVFISIFLLSVFCHSSFL